MNGRIGKRSESSRRRELPGGEERRGHLPDQGERRGQLLKEERLQPLRKKLLTSALPYYENFIKQRADDPRVRRDLAAAYLRASRINVHIGMNEEGQEQAAQAVEIYERVARGVARRQGAAQVRWPTAIDSLADLQYDAGQTKAALDSFSRVIELQELLWSEDPSNVELGRSSLTATPGERAEERRRRRGRGGRRWPAVRGNLRETAFDQPAGGERTRLLEDSLPRTTAAVTLSSCLKAIEIYRARVESRGPERVTLRGPEGVNLFGPLKNAGYIVIFIGQPAEGGTALVGGEAIVRKMVPREPQVGPLISCTSISRWAKWVRALSCRVRREPRGRRWKRPWPSRRSCSAERSRSAAPGLSTTAWFSYLLGRLECESGDFAGGLGHCELAHAGDEQKLRDADDRAWERTTPWL